MVLNRLRSRSTLVLLDQVASSASNLAVTIEVAHRSTVEQFGYFSLVYVGIGFVLGCQRALLGETFLITEQKSRDGGTAAEQGAGAVLMVTLLFSAVTAAALSAVGCIIGSTLVILAGPVCLVVLVQDIMRYLCIGKGLYSRLLLLDCVWLIAIGCGHLAAAGVSQAHIGTYWLLVWGIGALIGVAIGLLSYRPSASGAQSWWRRHARLGGGLLLETLLISGLSQVLLLLLPLVASVATVAAVRVAQTVTNPALLTITALCTATLPQLAREAETKGIDGAKAIAVRWAKVDAAFGVLCAVVIYLVPDSWGSALFGPSWVGGSSAAPLVALQWATVGVTLQAIYIFRVSGFQWLNVRIRLIVTPVTMVIVLGAAFLDSAVAVAWALLVCAMGAAVTWWIFVGKASEAGSAVGRHTAAPPEPAAAIGAAVSTGTGQQ